MISDIDDPATPHWRELLDCGCRAEYGLTALAMESLKTDRLVRLCWILIDRRDLRVFAPLPRTLAGRVDVVVGVVPYVPTPALPLLPRDTLAFESPLSYDGGRDGTEILRRVLTDSPRFLRRGGALLLELGGEQADALGDDLARLGYVDVTVFVDEDGDVRGIEATLGEQR